MKVNWNEKICQHAGVCVKTLPAVFKVEGGTLVIDPSAASEDEVKSTVAACPSGALTTEG